MPSTLQKDHVMHFISAILTLFTVEQNPSNFKQFMALGNF